jgi:pilus assembly protein Flp/PilA
MNLGNTGVGYMWKSLWLDESGGEILEYALVAGLIICAALAVIASVGNNVLASWSSANGSM